MATLVENLSVVLNILKVVFGLGFVIFLHELGHFLAAKWAGVKVEKFFLGFDPYGLRVATFTYGETTYGIGAVPLGGYVKMLGEDPGDGEETSSDPRAFSNKSVGARTVILSAGVAMNLLLGLTLFTITHMLGVQEMPARLGAIQAGSPAFEAGLRPGDEVVSIDGRGDVNFMRLRLKVSLSAANQVLNLGIKRPGLDGLLTIPVAPKRSAKADMPNIGITPSDSLTLFDVAPYRAPSGIDGPAPPDSSIPGGGRVVEAGPVGGPLVAVEDNFALDRVLVENRDRPVDVIIEAPTKPGNISTPERIKATLPVTRFLTFGLRLTPGPILSIQKGSIAETSGFQIGDRIKSVDGRDDYDPLRLADDLSSRAGQPVKFVVSRSLQGTIGEVEVTATPAPSLPWSEPPLSPTAPTKVSGLGFAMSIEPIVAAVTEGSPAAKNGITPGAVLESITFPPSKDDPKGKPSRFVFAEPAKAVKSITQASWTYIFWLLQALPRSAVELTIAGNASPISMTPEIDPSWSNPARGLGFVSEIRDVPPQPFGVALKRGWNETYDNVVSIYAMIRSLFAGLVSPKNLAGLPRIANIAYQTASLGIVPLLSFLGMLSINLAVLNFLPIPPLDGGQIAFLVAEKIRGKPLPETTLFIFMVGGIALVGCLMLYTIVQDIVLMVLG